MKCLLVNRHKLLEPQKKDLDLICSEITTIDTLPEKSEELKNLVLEYDAIIGNFPLPIYQSLLQLKKRVFRFSIKSIGTATSEEEVEKFKEKYKDFALVQIPNKPGELYRLSIYVGIEEIMEVKIVSKLFITHEL